MKTRKIKVNQLWPGMILTDHTYRGRIVDITSCNAHGQVRVTFDDVFEVFHHEGGHMIEPDPDDDMPLDDWREPEPPGWYWRDCCTGHDPVGPFPTSRAALEDADVWNPVFDEN